MTRRHDRLQRRRHHDLRTTSQRVAPLAKAPLRRPRNGSQRRLRQRRDEWRDQQTDNEAAGQDVEGSDTDPKIA